MVVNFVDGNVLSADDLNSGFKSFSVVSVYSGSSFNTSFSGTGTQTNSYEFSAISSYVLANADYLSISVLGKSNIFLGEYDSAYTKVKIEIKEVGGSYYTLFDDTHLEFYSNSNGSSVNTSNISYLHELTSGEKSNGVQVKISSTSHADSATVSFTNKQTILKLESGN